MHQERVEQLKTDGSIAAAGDSSNADTSNNEFNRWVEEDDDDDDDVSRDKIHHMKANVNSTAQQLLTSITQPVRLINANGQQIETTIDMKALGGQGGGGGSSMPSAPMAVPVSTSWTTDAGSSRGHGHYDLKDLSSSAANDVEMLIQSHTNDVPTTTTSGAAASMPSIVDMHHHQGGVQHRQLVQQQQIFLTGQQFQEMASHKKVGVVVAEMKGSMNSPHDEEERLTVVEDDESSSNPVA